MSEPVSVVTTFLDALAAGDSRRALDLLDVDIEWRNTGLPTLRGRRATGALIGMEKRGVGFGYTMHAAAAEGDVVLTDRTDWLTLGRWRSEFWVRGTFPRLRIDQLMGFAWKVMVPLSFLSVVMTAIYQFYEWPAWSLTLMSSGGLAVVGYLIYKKMTGPSRLVAEVRARQEALEAQRRSAQFPAGGN